MNNDVPKELGESNQRLSTFVLSAIIEWHMTSISDHLMKIVKVSKAGNLVSHEISAMNLLKIVSICIYLSSHQETEPFLKRICTGDEREVLYVKYELKRKWFVKGQKALPMEKRELHSNRVLICVWRNWPGYIQSDIPDQSQTITTDIYSQK